MEVLDKFAHMDFQWCSDIPGGHGDPVELVRGLENSRTDLRNGPGVLKTSNQFYGLLLTPTQPGSS